MQAILREINLLFPTMNITRDDVLYSWAGVRPRTAAGSTPLGSMEVKEHDLHANGLPNFVVFTGGLLMTHRDAGRRITKAIRRHLPPSRPAAEIDYSTPAMPDCCSFSEDAVRWTIEREQASTLAGILRRRLSMGWEADLGLGVVEQTAAIAAPLLGWDAQPRQQQIDDFRKSTEFFYSKVPERRAPVE